MTAVSITAADLIATLRSMEDARQRTNLLRFFKTGPGEYGEGDWFIGLKVPQVRLVVKEARLQVSLEEIGILLQSEWHEARLCGFLLLVEEMKAALPRSRNAPTKAVAGTGKPEAVVRAERREEIARFYLRHTRRANNWDLVDMSCPKILGPWLLYPLPDGTLPDRSLLDRLAKSDCLWEQRIAIITCWSLIREGQTDDALRLSTALLGHPHDLIHKAVGWMLREVGKRHPLLLEQYLDAHVHEMHRTTLRYAIEKMPEPERQHWLRR